MPAIDSLDRQDISSDVIEIIEAAPMPGLDATPKCATTAKAIEVCLAESSSIAGALRESALWLLAGELDRSHQISQSTETQSGSYWHGIMHRREGDYSNSKYWFRRAGNHPAIRALAKQIDARQADLTGHDLPVRDLLDVSTVAAKLSELSQEAVRDEPEWSGDLQRILWWEWQLLFGYQH